jgi:hypothetical protein
MMSMMMDNGLVEHFYSLLMQFQYYNESEMLSNIHLILES